MPIEFHSTYDSFTIRNKKLLSECIQLIAFTEECEIENLNYVFCSDDYLLNLNKQFLNHQTYTDIITFDYKGNKGINGEVYISVDRVKENSLIYRQQFQTEIHRVVFHGVLHLCGYNDKTGTQKKTMRMKEDFYLHMFDESFGSAQAKFSLHAK